MYRYQNFRAILCAVLIAIVLAIVIPLMLSSCTSEQKAVQRYNKSVKKAKNKIGCEYYHKKFKKFRA